MNARAGRVSWQIRRWRGAKLHYRFHAHDNELALACVLAIDVHCLTTF